MDELIEKIVEFMKSELFLFFRRRFFFFYRDYDKVLVDYESGRGFFFYIGRGLSGLMYIGYIILFFVIKWF